MKIKFSLLKFFTLIKNSRGFSIAEVMVAAGLLGVVSLGVMEITKQTTKTQKKANIDLDLNQMTYDIMSLMRDPASCIAAISANDAARTATPTGASPFRVINGSDGAAVSFTTIKRFAHDVGKTDKGVAYQTSAAGGTYYGAIKNIRINSMKVIGKYPAAGPTTPNMTADGVHPFKVSIEYAVKAPAGALGSSTVKTGTITEVMFTKNLEVQAYRIASTGYVTSCGADTNSDLEAACKLFGGTIVTTAGQMRCTSLNIYPSSPSVTTMNSVGDMNVAGGASITEGLDVNKGYSVGQGHLQVNKLDANVKMGPSLILDSNFTMGGTTISATSAQTANIGTSAGVATVMGLGGSNGSTLNMGTGNAAASLNIGAGSGNGSLNVAGATGVGTLNVGGGSAANPSAGNATVEGVINWGASGTAGQLKADGTIELGKAPGNSINSTPSVDFHYNGAVADTSRIISESGGLRLINSAGANLMLSNNGAVDSSLTGTYLTVPTADYVFGADMTRAVNKDWVYNVLTGAVANSFFDSSRSDAIISHIINNATAGLAYDTLREAILNHLASTTIVSGTRTGRFLGAAGAQIGVAGANGIITYTGTQCPANYNVSRIYLAGTPVKYYVDCYPNCMVSGSPCTGLYANTMKITTSNGGSFEVSNGTGTTAQLCLNGNCRTNWAQGGNGPTPGECSSEGDFGKPLWYVYGIAPNGSVKCRRWGGFP